MCPLYTVPKVWFYNYVPDEVGGDDGAIGAYTSYDDDTNATAQHTPTHNTKIVIITSQVYIMITGLYEWKYNFPGDDTTSWWHRTNTFNAQSRISDRRSRRQTSRGLLYARCRSKKSRLDQCRPSNVTLSGPGLLVILYASNLKKKKCTTQ